MVVSRYIGFDLTMTFFRAAMHRNECLLPTVHCTVPWHRTVQLLNILPDQEVLCKLPWRIYTLHVLIWDFQKLSILTRLLLIIV